MTTDPGRGDRRTIPDDELDLLRTRAGVVMDELELRLASRRALFSR